ncbi:MAG: SDR family NAD(P)-dependent oxidoreductase [Planctomycetota bacterium]
MLNNKVVVITGASSGIGAQLACECSRRGANVVLAARREKELREVAAECDGETLCVVADVTKRGDVQRLLDQAVAKLGHVDVWVNNAGRGISKPILTLTDDDVDEMYRANLLSALYGMQIAAAHFQSRNSGQIINVSSMLGRVPFASIRSAYSAMKHALNSLTCNLRVDLKQTHPGIHVTLFLPGVVATDFGLNARGGGPDSRSMPFAQPVEEVAKLLADAMEKPCAEVYSRPVYREHVARYYTAEDVAVIESQPPFVVVEAP